MHSSDAKTWHGHTTVACGKTQYLTAVWWPKAFHCDHKPTSRQTSWRGEAETGQGGKFSDDGSEVTQGRGARGEGKDLLEDLKEGKIKCVRLGC